MQALFLLELSPHNRFFAESLPSFSFFRGVFVLPKSAQIGNEVNESKSRELPTLWRLFAKRPLAGTESFGSENATDKMPAVRRSQSVQRWISGCAFRKVAALSLQRLYLPIFLLLKLFPASSLFSICLKKSLLKRQPCEFVYRIVYLGAQGRKLSFNGSCCPLSVLVLKVFVSWLIRTRILKQQEL